MNSAGIKRTYGLIRQRHDPLDALRMLHVRKAVTDTLPNNFELDTSPCLFGNVPQEDQGQLGSCGPNSAAECIMYDQLTEGVSLSPPSRLFIYYVARMLMNSVNQDSGVDNRTMLQALAQFGFCSESMWPYQDDSVTFRQKPSAACFQAALANRINSANPVNVDALQIRGMVYSKRLPVLFGFDVFAGIESEQAATTGVIPDPGPTESPIGGHDVDIVGYDTNGFGKISGAAYKIRNHWMNGPGVPWGDNGYGYISEKYAISPHASDLWVINAIPGGVAPIPLPPPTPIPTPKPDMRLAVLESLAKIEGFSYDAPGVLNTPYRLGVK